MSKNGLILSWREWLHGKSKVKSNTWKFDKSFENGSPDICPKETAMLHAAITLGTNPLAAESKWKISEMTSTH